MYLSACVCSAAFYAPQLLERHGCLSRQTFVAICNPLISLYGKKRALWRPQTNTEHTQIWTPSHRDVSASNQVAHHENSLQLLLLSYSRLMLHLLFSSQQKPPNNDWRFTQGQRPGPSGWVNGHTHTHSENGGVKDMLFCCSRAAYS